MLVRSPVLHVSGVPRPITCMESVSSHRHFPFRKSAEEGFTVGLRSAKGRNAFKDCCEALRWLLLSDRRLYFSLIECYKIIVFELNNLCFCDCFELASKVTRSNHSYKLQVKMGKL